MFFILGSVVVLVWVKDQKLGSFGIILASRVENPNTFYLLLDIIWYIYIICSICIVQLLTNFQVGHTIKVRTSLHNMYLPTWVWIWVWIYAYIYIRIYKYSYQWDRLRMRAISKLANSRYRWSKHQNTINDDCKKYFLFSKRGEFSYLILLNLIFSFY